MTKYKNSIFPTLAILFIATFLFGLYYVYSISNNDAIILGLLFILTLEFIVYFTIAYGKRHIKKLNLSLKSIFLIDAIGAFLTAILMFAFSSILNEYFGMPQIILRMLSIIALIISIYSFFCFAISSVNSQKLLKLLIAANLAYCILIVCLLVVFFNKLTILELLYFVGEVVIMIVLAYFEILTLNSNKPNNQ